MSEQNLQQAADREHGNTPPSLLKVVGLVFVVAFVLLLFSFLMELRGNEEESQQLGNVIEERESLRAQVIELEAEIGALESELAETKTAAEAEWKAMDEEIYFLERRVEELTRETRSKVTEKADMLLATVIEWTEMQGVSLNSLTKEKTQLGCIYYYDRANRCYYAVYDPHGLLANALVKSYMSELSRFFENENYADVMLELQSVIGLLHSGHWVTVPEEELYYYEKVFDLEGSFGDYMIRLYTDETGFYDGSSLFELVRVT